MKNGAEVENKIAQLKKLGLEEYFVVQEAGELVAKANAGFGIEVVAPLFYPGR